MSEALRVHPTVRLQKSTALLDPPFHFLFPRFVRQNHALEIAALKTPSMHRKSPPLSDKIYATQQDFLQELDDSPVSVELLPICSESQFDRVIADAQQLDKSVIVVWMASWCRKCIYLEPKLEKLAADYCPRVRFYSINVNSVPHKLVARAGVTKMPTIQLWKDGKKQDEVIGGHKAHLVVNEVRDMIENGSLV